MLKGKKLNIALSSTRIHSYIDVHVYSMNEYEEIIKMNDENEEKIYEIYIVAKMRVRE